MFKKITLMMVIITASASNVAAMFWQNPPPPVVIVPPTDIKTPIAVGAASAVVAGVVSASAMYLYCREANGAKIQKVDRLWRHVTDNVARVRPEDLSKLVPIFKDFDIFAYELQADLQGRYVNWLTPWNWFPSMRLAYKKVTMLSILFRHLEVLGSWHATISDGEIERLGKTICAGQYSATMFVASLNDEISTMSKISQDVYCPFGKVLCDHLVAIRNIVMQSNAYRQENLRPANAV